MSDYDNNMSGAIFKNDKGDNPARPDYRGQCEIDGREMWISAWIKEPKSGGDKFMSLSFQDKDEKPKTQDNSDKTPF